MDSQKQLLTQQYKVNKAVSLKTEVYTIIPNKPCPLRDIKDKRLFEVLVFLENNEFLPKKMLKNLQGSFWSSVEFRSVS